MTEDAESLHEQAVVAANDAKYELALDLIARARDLKNRKPGGNATAKKEQS